MLRNSHNTPHSRILFLLAKPTPSIQGERGSKKHSGPGLAFVAGAEWRRESGKEEMRLEAWLGQITGALEDFRPE